MQTNCGYKHNDTAHVVKLSLMDLKFRMLQHSSLEANNSLSVIFTEVKMAEGVFTIK